MATIIKIKHSLTAGNIPASLQDGELAINEADETLHYKNAAGVIRGMALPIAADALATTGLQINGGMELDREHLGGAVVIPNSIMTYVVDQWQFGFVHTANTAVFSASQSALNAPAILGNNLSQGLRALGTTALVSPNSGDYACFQQPIEGYRWERLNWGQASPKPISIGFWVFSTAAGTGSVTVRNGALTRSYVANFTVTSSNTWQLIIVSGIPGDITGTWLGSFNIGAYVGFCFASGSAYQTTVNTWATGNFLATPANTNFFATNGNVVIITGVSILSGSNMPTASRFGSLLRSSDVELYLCMRYWERGNQLLFYAPFGSGVTTASGTLPLMAKRVNPTMVMTGFQYYSGPTPSAVPVLTTNVIYTDHFEFTASNMINWNGWANSGIWTANARM